MFRCLIVFIVFLCLVDTTARGQFSPDQKRKIDSLENIISQEVHDTVRVASWHHLINLLKYGDAEICLKNAFELDSACTILLNKKVNDKVRYTIASYQILNYENIIRLYMSLGNYDLAEFYADKRFITSQKLGDQKLVVDAYINYGEMSREQGKFEAASNYYMKALDIAEELGYSNGIAGIYVGLAHLHSAQGDIDKAEEYDLLAAKYYELTGNQNGKAIALNNVAALKSNAGNTEAALEFWLEANDLFQEANNYVGTSTTLNNIGTIHHKNGDYDQAISFYYRAIDDAKKIKDLKLIANSLNNVAHIYRHQGLYQKAVEINSEALEYARQSNHIIALRNVVGGRYLMLKDAGDYKGALEYYIKYQEILDSIDNTKIRDVILKNEMQYQFDKAHLADSLEFVRQEQITSYKHEKELLKKRQSLILLFGGLSVTLIFGGIVFNRFRITKKQKEIIEKAHLNLEKKNQEILDSLNYAKRIQTAILPPNDLIKKYLPNSFVLYKPKDIVAGDFYWLSVQDNCVLFAAADCTGHGVPGAMVSVICNNGLNKSVNEYGLKDPGKILDKTREIVISEFEKSEEKVKDGMDIALCSLSMRNENDTHSHSASHFLKYAGAHNPIWIVRKGVNEVEEIKANKQPIGQFENPIPYQTKNIELQKGDSFYIFSDGYADQFGGDKGKKFKAKNLKRLLLSIQNEPMETQKKSIDEAFENWKGNLEQLDDVCVIGVRI